MDATTRIVDAVRQLKVDRDTWKAIALQYKTALESQTARLQELQDICFATQAELENERAQYRCLRTVVASAPHESPVTLATNDQPTGDEGFGSAIILSPKRINVNWQVETSGDSNNPIFGRVQQFASHLNYGTALVEIERLLRGPLSSKARAEGLLLKSSILQATGPDSLYDALAVCSEAIELCDRVSELRTLLPKIQYQRGLYCYQLCMLQQAQDAFRAASEDSLLSAKANEYRRSCDAELEMLQSDRRSAFDESRSSTGDILAELDDGSPRGNLRRTRTHFKHRATQKVKRMSLPHRWISSANNSSSKTDNF